MSQSIAASFIRELSARTDLVALIGTRLDFRSRSGKNHFASCPFHDDKTPSFSVNEAESFYHCFSCKRSGDAIRFLMDHDQLTFVEAVETLAQFNGMEVVYEQHSHSQHPPRDHARHDLGLSALAAAAEFFHQALFNDEASAARAYLRDRNLTKSILTRFQIGYAPSGNALLAALGGRFSHEVLQATGLIGEKDGRHYDWFRDRIIFPIRNPRGQVIAFGARAMGDAQPKYLNSSESEWFNKRHELYGLYEALQHGQRDVPLMVTEGYMDVVKLSQHGMEQAVAALGTAIGDSHIQQLKKRSKKVYFSFDGDSAGQKAAEKALEAVLRLHDEKHQWRFVFMPDGEDPDSLIERDGVAAVQALLDSSLTPSQFLIRLLEAQKGERSTVEAGAEVAALAKQWLGYLPGGAYRELLADELGKHFQLSSRALNEADEARTTTFSAKPRRHAEYVRASAPQPMDQRLAALLFAYPQWALEVRLADYSAQLAASLPLTIKACYSVQATTQDQAQETLEQLFIREGVLEEMRAQCDALARLPADTLHVEWQDSLRMMSQRMIDQQARLEKFGG
ncbi:DNA primase [Suttonella sp. R2A3]|uniref:DNA primase n=1 Tax=Suttonella sp. R2A3 TaxID=2908648 RepID=UPI001F17C6C8|nr:DNA primase [Suttonella sp. R2A3]UJF24341.1 DNA primase [Suttonella sp. R2A3]